MLSLGALGFAAPLALIALASLPILYLLLRATPPAPRRTPFPPMRLLADTDLDEETPRRTPLWLIILRLLIATLVILGLARPILFPREEGPSQPLLLVVDDDWAAAANWDRIAQEAQARIDVAARTGQPVTLAFTAPRLEAETDIAPQDPGEARDRLQQHEPAAWTADRAALAARLEAAELPDGQAVYLTNGVGGDGTDELLAAMRSHGAVTALTPDVLNAPLALRPPRSSARGFEAQVVRAGTAGTREGEIAALSSDGRLVARASFAFAEGQDIVTAEAQIPAELRRRVSLVRITSSPSSGGAAAIGDAWARPSVGIVVEGAEDAQPLLSDLYYLGKALEPFAEAYEGSLEQVLEQQPGLIALVDGAGSATGSEDALLQYVRDGGVLLRFAGPLLSAGRDTMLPVLLREGGRDFGGALAWGEPQHLAPFADTSPFAGLAIPDEVTIARQVLAEPEADLTSKTWARLQDGTPLVTAEREGQGWIVLFHVTAGPDWSSLPLSGLYPEMLERVTAYAESGVSPAAEVGAAWVPDRILAADGRLVAPPPGAQPIAAADWATAVPGPATPPGLYRRGASQEGLNIAGEDFTLQPFPRTGATVEDYGEAAPRAMAGSLLILALLLLAADAIAALVLSGRAPRLLRRFNIRLRPSRGAVAGLALALLLLPSALPAPARAQDDAAAEPAPAVALPAGLVPAGTPPPEGVDDVRLAYILTGDPQVDAMSRAGLVGLSLELIRRTSIEPLDPIGVDPATDDLIFFPLVYWPVTRTAQPLAPEAAARLDEYVRSGGTVLIDTQDAGSRITEGDTTALMQRALAGIDLPPLTIVPEDHVLTKAFFLTQDFPGRWAQGRVWVEAETPTGARDGVSGWIVGGNDWAAAWAVDDQGNYVAALPNAQSRQREYSYRFGINLVMYVLTGNYKSDQVHVPDLLQRLGREEE